MIAVVRHCKSTEDQFSIGVERVDDWLVARAVAEPETVSSPAVSKLAVLPAETTEGEPVRVVGRAKVKHLNMLTKVATQQLFVTMMDRAKRRAKMKQASKKVLTVAGAAFGLLLAGLLLGRIPPNLRGGSLTPASTAVDGTRALPKSQPNGSGQSNGTNKVNGTDLSQQQPAAPPQPPAQLKPATQQQPQATPVVTARTNPTNPSVAPPADPVAHQKQHTLLVTSNGANWVVACADGKRVFEKLLNAGDTSQIAFSTQALLNAGNAAALDVTLDSHSLGAMGRPGTIHAWRFSGETHEDVPPAHNQTCEMR